VCEEYHKFVLNHCHKKDVPVEGVLEIDDVDIDITDDDDPWAKVKSQMGIESFRPLQQQALDIIQQVSTLSQTAVRMATAGVVTPTSSGKDLLPLALSLLANGVCIMFVPFKCVCCSVFVAYADG